MILDVAFTKQFPTINQKRIDVISLLMLAPYVHAYGCDRSCESRKGNYWVSTDSQNLWHGEKIQWVVGVNKTVWWKSNLKAPRPTVLLAFKIFETYSHHVLEGLFNHSQSSLLTQFVSDMTLSVHRYWPKTKQDKKTKCANSKQYKSS